MKSLKLLPLLAFSLSAHAGPEFSAGLSGGTMVTDGLEVIGPAWLVLPRFGINLDETLGFEASLGYQQGRTRIGGRDADGTQQPDFAYTGITPRLDLVGKLWTRGKRLEDGTFGKPPILHPTLAVGLGGFYKSTDDGGALGEQYNRKDLDFLANAGPGLMMPLGAAHLRTDFRWVLSLGRENFQNRGDQFLNWEWTLGVGFTFGGGPKDSDGDGILDDVDQCPNEPEDMDQHEDDDGCPDLDNDGDGILDAVDQCPNEAEDKDEHEDDDGCPDLDNDGDGIPDTEDDCPMVPGHESGKGCPDQDGDGLLDAVDECPDEAGGAESFGCPDSDGDRVPDYRDMCPDEPGPRAADPLRSDGCPATVFVTEKAISITEKVFFDTGKATIQAKSFQLLDEIAATMKKYPGIKKVSVEGHTDNVGVPANNKTLSENRAKAVVDYLVTKGGIDAERLTSVGFGQDKPLVDGDAANTNDGRAQNRRVEFNITEQEQQKTQLKRPTITLRAPETALTLAGIKATKTPLPEDEFLKEPGTCKVGVDIDVEGKVKRVRITECVGLPRLAAGKAFAGWEFEPYKVNDAATAISTVFTMVIKDGAATVTHDPKAIKPTK